MLIQLTKREQTIAELLAKLDQSNEDKEAISQSKEELEQRIERSTRAANTLKFDEETTRLRLIDNRLISAHWDVGATGQSTDQVGQEVELSGLRTTSGEGFADYVLYDLESGKPLAVVEAKRTALDPQKGQHQAKDYADGLEKEHGVRPVIFYTNGYEIWIWNDAHNEPPRPVHGFYSEESLKILHHQNRERKESLGQCGPDINIVDRPYQIEAIQRICEKFDSRKRRALLVQATGTGKTRVAVALSKLIVDAGWAKRILFLCDRRELRKQAKDAFAEFMPGSPWTYVGSDTHNETSKHIYMGTYPAMAKCFENFDVGFFDLVIADESHRSIYNGIWIV